MVLWMIDSVHRRNPAEDSVLLRQGVLLAPRSDAVYGDAPDSAIARVAAIWLPRIYRPDVLAPVAGHFERFAPGADSREYFPGGCGACRPVLYSLDRGRVLVVALSSRPFGERLYTFIDTGSKTTSKTASTTGSKTDH
jgi:hypothetical protein